jgi:glutathionyl-hydroquinone reductase
MGQLINGVWRTDDQTVAKDGAFRRAETSFRNWITPDGSAGLTGEGGFKAEPGRYHLYVSWACPWAHRTLIFRKIKGLEDMIGISSVHAYKGDDGWTFEPGSEVIPDPVLDADLLRDVYLAADPKFTGRVTVPILWDKERNTIVSNESSEIIRMFNSAFDGVGAASGDYYPEDLRAEIDQVNSRVYDTVNNGVYKCGFARSQEAYDAAVKPLFESLDWLELRLANQRYLMGERLTEADWRLFTTLVRFDAVYHTHFKCTRSRIMDYANLWDYTRDLYQFPGVAETVKLDIIREHYYTSHESVNPSGIIPVLPKGLNFDMPHGREEFASWAS